MRSGICIVFLFLWRILWAGVPDTLFLSQLPLGDKVKESGRILVDLPEGFTLVTDGSSSVNDTATVILIHGYGTRGYEWVEPLHQFCDQFGTVLFYRYNWSLCPDSAAGVFWRYYQDLPARPRKPVIIISHSYGGLVMMNFLPLFPDSIRIQAHAIAAPLAGYPRLTKSCPDFDPLTRYARLGEKQNLTLIQWRTNPKLDGAFKDMTEDPQNVPGINMIVFQLPDTMDGHRLGHNWSVTWVARHFPGR